MNANQSVPSGADGQPPANPGGSNFNQVPPQYSGMPTSAAGIPKPAAGVSPPTTRVPSAATGISSARLSFHVRPGTSEEEKGVDSIPDRRVGAAGSGIYLFGARRHSAGAS